MRITVFFGSFIRMDDIVFGIEEDPMAAVLVLAQPS